MNKCKIAILCKNEENLTFVQSCFEKFGYVNYKLIQDVNNEKEFKLVEYDLIIIDSCSGLECTLLSKLLGRPVLMMLQYDPDKIDDFEFNVLDQFNICDFVRKPYSEKVFIAKIKILLKIEGIYRALDSDRSRILGSLWNLLNYSNIYVVVLDKSLNIKLINWPLANLIGFENERNAINKYWIDYLPDYDKDLVERELNIVVSNEKCGFEMTNDVQSKDEIESIKWFITFINTSINWVFCLGTPVSKDISSKDNIDTLRAYFKDIIIKDRDMIQSIKDMQKNITTKEIESDKNEINL